MKTPRVHLPLLTLLLAAPCFAQDADPQPSPTGAPTQNTAATAPPAQSTVVAAPVPPRIPAAAEVPAAFCASSASTEVLKFCPFLTQLQAQANSHTVLELGDTLRYLNPAGRQITELVAVSVSVKLATQTAAANLLQLADQNRTDQQLGSNSSASGTTTVVSKAGSAELLSLALDTGAVTQSVSGTTATLTTNADHLFRLVTGRNSDCLMDCPDSSDWVGKFEEKALDPLTITASFQIGQNDTSTTATSGQASGASTPAVSSVAIPTGAGKLTAIGAKYEIVNSFDPRKPAFKTAWQKQVTASLNGPAATVVTDVNAVYKILLTDPTFSANQYDTTYWNTLYAAAQSDSSGAALVAQFEALWNKDLSVALKNKDLPAAVATLIKDRQDFAQAWKAAVAAAAGNLLTIQYNYNKPLSQPATHDFTFIYGYNWGTTGSITANGAFSIYDGTLPAGAQYGRLHYGQLSTEYDRNLSNPIATYQMQMSLAGYWQYQPQPSVLNIPAGTVAPGTTIPLPNGTQEFVGTAGSLWVTQGKLTIKGPNGINVPIGVSWSNKTDLLQGSKVGAQIGLSYNFSTLAGLF